MSLSFIDIFVHLFLISSFQSIHFDKCFRSYLHTHSHTHTHTHTHTQRDRVKRHHTAPLQKKQQRARKSFLSKAHIRAVTGTHTHTHKHTDTHTHTHTHTL